MKAKKLGILALGVASVMSVSVGLIGCDKKEGKGGPSLISDETLADKFVAMFTFEDDAYDEDLAQIKVPAVDPYTGEAIEGVYAAYDPADSSNATNPGAAKKNGASLSGATSLYLTSINKDGFFKGSVETGVDETTGDSTFTLTGNEGGISYSFWYNSAEATNSDWDAMITSEFTAGCIVNYGNVSWVGGSAFPSGGAVHGRAAYTDTSYAAAQSELALGQLRSSNTYTVYNAMCPEGLDADGYVAEMGNAITDTWLYITVVVSNDEISFYRDGVLAYSYTSDKFAAGVAMVYENLYMDLLSPGLGTKMFGTGSDSKVFSVDELLIGKELTAAQVRALYENVSGTKLADSDVTLSSSVVATTAIASETYTGAWFNAELLAQVLLPKGDFDITYTADLYTARVNAWEGPEFCIVDQDELGLNTPAPGGGMCMCISPNNGAQPLNSDILAADKNEDGSLKIEFTKESTDDTFKYTLSEDVLYTKTDEEEGLTTNICTASPVKLIVNIVREGNEWTVTYYQTEEKEENIIWAFTVQCSNTDQLVMNIGGDGCYMENIKIDNGLTLSRTTSGAKAPVSTEGFTEVK